MLFTGFINVKQTNVFSSPVFTTKQKIKDGKNVKTTTLEKKQVIVISHFLEVVSPGLLIVPYKGDIEILPFNHNAIFYDLAGLFSIESVELFQTHLYKFKSFSYQHLFLLPGVKDSNIFFKKKLVNFYKDFNFLVCRIHYSGWYKPFAYCLKHSNQRVPIRTITQGTNPAIISLGEYDEVENFTRNILASHDDQMPKIRMTTNQAESGFLYFYAFNYGKDELKARVKNKIKMLNKSMFDDINVKYMNNYLPGNLSFGGIKKIYNVVYNNCSRSDIIL